MANHEEMLFTSLKEQIDRLKEGVDKCHTPSIYIHTFKIASLMKNIDLIENKTDLQKKVISRLDEKAFIQFQRVSNGRCSCKIDKNI